MSDPDNGEQNRPTSRSESPGPGDRLRRTPLASRHEALGAKTADFGGWLMPIEYAGTGVLREHRAVREAVGLFDVSHLGKLEVTGPGAADLVDSCLTDALDRIGPGQAQYTLCCAEDGGTVDDLIVYLRSPEDLLLVPNAANSAEVARRLAEAAPDGVRVRDRHDDLAVLAVQGPLSDEVLGDLGLPAGHGYMHFAEGEVDGVPVTVCRTGYTGERGYELLPPADRAGEVWDALAERVRARGGVPVGLGARDTLRTEMGYALHGHELSEQISPVMARLGWAVGWDKPSFWGREALLGQRERKDGPLARGLLTLERGVPRAGMTVLDPARDGAEVGRTTSGTFSPTLGQGVALALLDRSVALDSEVALDVRGRRVAARVVNPPFVESHVRED